MSYTICNAQVFSIKDTVFSGGSEGTSINNSRKLEYAKNKAALSKYGGFTDVKLTATGHFRTEIYNNQWYFVDPDGYLYFGMGINTVKNNATYPSLNLPSDLEEVGFNHLANWSEFKDINSGTKKMSYVFRELFMQTYKNESQINKDLWNDGIIAVFDPEFKNSANEIAQIVALNKDDPYCIGVFSDNEMPIYTNSSFGELLDRYLNISDKSNPNYKATNEWMISRKGENYVIDETDRNDFHGYLMKTYYEIVYNAIKTYAPNMLYLGSRLHGAAKDYSIIYKESAPYIDVFSVNYYSGYEPNVDLLKTWEEVSNKPFIISEFYAKGFDVNIENDQGAGFNVPTQSDRALYFENFVINLLESKGCAGYQWFRFQDDSSNKGVINAQEEWYPELRSSLIKINKDVYELRTHLKTIKEINEKNVVKAIEDTYVRGGDSANINYNNEPLRVKESATSINNTRQALLKFNLSDYSSITSATLHLKGSQSSGSIFNVTVSGINDDSWNETTVTWNSKPIVTNSLGVFSTIKTSSTTYADLEVDVTDFVKEQLMGDKIVSFHLSDQDATVEQLVLKDKESTNDPAYLQIENSSLSIDDNILKSGLNLHPNPTSNDLRITSNKSKISSLKICSINGEELLSKNNLNSDFVTVDLSYFELGVYLIYIKSVNGNTVTQKLIKN